MADLSCLFQIAKKPATSIWTTRHQDVIPVKTGIQALSLRRQGTILYLDSDFHREPWIPASAGMTARKEDQPSRFKVDLFSELLAFKARVVQSAKFHDVAPEK